MRPHKAVENVTPVPASTAGGQHGVIAEDRRLRRAEAQEGTPSSKIFLDWFPAFAGMTEFGCYSIYISNLFRTTVYGRHAFEERHPGIESCPFSLGKNVPFII